MSTQTIIAESLDHLKALVKDAVLTAGPTCDLNHIDVSGITEMRRLFNDLKFNGDVSKWDVSGVRVFDEMFRDSPFDGDLSSWNVSSATSMRRMFQNSPFKGDLAKWTVGALVVAGFMYDHARFAGDVSAWRPVSLKDADHMFHCCRFNSDVSNWNLPNLRNATAMFDKTPFTGDLSSWHLPKVHADYATRLVPGAYTGVLPHIGGDFSDRREFYTAFSRHDAAPPAWLPTWKTVLSIPSTWTSHCIQPPRHRAFRQRTWSGQATSKPPGWHWAWTRTPCGRMRLRASRSGAGRWSSKGWIFR